MYAYTNQNGYGYLMSEQGGIVNGQFVRHTLSDANDFVDQWVSIAPGPLGEYYNC
jgi:hypothetical protein